MGEKMSTRTRAILATAALLIAIIVLVSTAILMNLPSPAPTSSSEKQEEDVLAIGKKYFEEKYGTDYFVNSVGPISYTETGPNGTVNYDYPAATFRVPADMQKPGLLVYVMVNPRTREIVKTFTSYSKSLPPSNPMSNIRVVNSTYLNYSSGESSKIFLVSAESRYDIWTQNDTHMDWFKDGPLIHKGDPVFVINATMRNDYTQNDLNKVSSTNYSAVVFSVKLYDKGNSVIDAQPAYPRVDTRLNGHVFAFKSGKIDSFELYLATDNRNVDHYEVLVELVSSVPPPS